MDNSKIEARGILLSMVRVYNVNTGKIIEEHVKVKGGKAMVHGDAEIKGVPGTGSPVELFFENPNGATTGKAFSTGSRKDILEILDHFPIEVTMIDCANPVVVVNAKV
ncbi:PrpF domain-containing protein [Petroclostridium sp. X23]|uniref:PrpF domain-containing protein n=1 Tax=Petroclostridium sp. X23 TaxID=3045146 RepID=UPI0024AE1207|nr:PrpF domain-containing protein [Petroclostridium sp. X23]WHH57790.1 PrpF domain-containing protein [Petroclostridium sp. X23]